MFKAKSSKKKFRSRRQSSDDDEDGSGDVEEVLKVAKEMQKVRKRQSGVGAVALATGAKISNEEEILVENDPFKMNSGGLVDMKKVKDRNRDRTYEDSDRDVTNLGTTFSAETNRRDEDAELASFIETEIRKRKGIKGDSASYVSHKSAEDQLFELPEHLKIAVKKQSEEMLSNQMLNGIPEIDLGIEVKIKNIERTEEAKQNLIREQINKKKTKATSFVPMNMAVNYVQHRRFMQEERQEKKAEKHEPEPAPLVVGDVSRQSNSLQGVKRQTNDKASDDFHYNKFRKQVRR